VNANLSAAILVAAIATSGCTSTADSLPTASFALPDRQEISAPIKLYNAKCARCHRFYHPANYSEAEWNSWMTRMSRKAHLKPDQQELLSRYLLTFRSTPAGVAR